MATRGKRLLPSFGCAHAALLGVAAALGCEGGPEPPAVERPRSPAKSSDPDPSKEARDQMLNEQLLARDIRDPRVLEAMRAVPRHEFVLPEHEERAYEDNALPIEHGQTISQPYIVALMTQLAEVGPGKKVLEVGTGSGYQAAVLDAIGAEVYSIEIIDALAKSADAVLKRLGYDVKVKSGDGYAGWPEHAPFDAVLVTAAPPAIPAPLEEQLAVGGKLVVPVGDRYQELMVITRTASGYERKNVLPVRFVPMTGRAQELR